MDISKERTLISKGDTLDPHLSRDATEWCSDKSPDGKLECLCAVVSLFLFFLTDDLFVFLRLKLQLQVYTAGALGKIFLEKDLVRLVKPHQGWFPDLIVAECGTPYGSHI